MAEDMDQDEAPDWVERLVERVDGLAEYFSVGQLDLRWTDEGEVVVAPAIFEVESDDETNGETGFGAFEIRDIAALAALLPREDGSPATVRCGPTQESNTVSLVADGRFEGHEISLIIQFEPFDDADATYILDLRPESEDEAGGNGDGAGG